ncbi:MAG: protein kinase [Muribaculaceae bacterium]
MAHECETDKSRLLTQALAAGIVIEGAGRKFVVVRALGAGGFGITYLVDCDGKPFVVKEHFLKGCWRDADGKTVRHAPTVDHDVLESRADFTEEARRLGILGNAASNIVKVYDTFEANGTAYYVMEYLDGGDLESYIKAHGPMREEEAVAMMQQIAKAVGILHASHILHLDVKPSNIVLKKNGADGTLIPVLIDFGIAKHFSSDGTPTSHLLAKGASSGYAPIEQYDDIKKFAPEIDVYALGGTLYFMLTGKNPPKAFNIESFDDLRVNLPEGISERIVSAIEGTMRRSANARTPSVDAFLSALAGTEVHTNATEVFVKARHRRVNRRKIRYIGAACAALLLAGIGIWVFFGHNPVPASQRMAQVAPKAVADTINRVADPAVVAMSPDTTGQDMLKELSVVEPGADTIVCTIDAKSALNSSSTELRNLMGDFILARGRELLPGVRGAIYTAGSLRAEWHPGPLSEKKLLNMMPFRDKICILEIKGTQFLDVLDQLGPSGHKRSDGIIKGFSSTREIEPNMIYRIATTGYLAGGGDYLSSLKNAVKIAESNYYVGDDFYFYAKKKGTIKTDPRPRTFTYADQPIAVQFKNALQSGDMNKISRFARQGYAPAFYPYADYCFLNKEYGTASYFAAKAYNAGTDKDEALSLMRMLKDFYPENELPEVLRDEEKQE